MLEFGVIIGQFQPFSNTHHALVRFALLKAKRLIIALGGHRRAKTIENPWSSDERKAMIESSLTPEELSRIEFVFVRDYLYNENLWIAEIQEKVDALTDGDKSVALIGHKRKPTSYLDLFPQWTFIESDDLSSDSIIKQDSTTGRPAADLITSYTTTSKIRDLYFTLDLLDIKRHVPDGVFNILKHDMMENSTQQRAEFVALKEEYHYVIDYKAAWKDAPYPPTFVTSDAVVIKSGHILVVRRRGLPGRGLIALPGGFINQNETIQDSSVRELREETRIKLTKDELFASFRESRVFDHPKRSIRGRTVTHAFCYDLKQGSLPKVKGDDDADKAWWMPLRDVLSSEERFFEDHFHIINHFVNKF